MVCDHFCDGCDHPQSRVMMLPIIRAWGPKILSVTSVSVVVVDLSHHQWGPKNPFRDRVSLYCRSKSLFRPRQGPRTLIESLRTSERIFGTKNPINPFHFLKGRKFSAFFPPGNTVGVSVFSRGSGKPVSSGKKGPQEPDNKKPDRQTRKS